MVGRVGICCRGLSVSKNMAVGSSEVALGEAALKCTKTCSPLYKR